MTIRDVSAGGLKTGGGRVSAGSAVPAALAGRPVAHEAAGGKALKNSRSSQKLREFFSFPAEAEGDGKPCREVQRDARACGRADVVAGQQSGYTGLYGGQKGVEMILEHVLGKVPGGGRREHQ